VCAPLSRFEAELLARIVETQHRLFRFALRWKPSPSGVGPSIRRPNPRNGDKPAKWRSAEAEVAAEKAAQRTHQGRRWRHLSGSREV
jgi:hypothetical protein